MRARLGYTASVGGDGDRGKYKNGASEFPAEKKWVTPVLKTCLVAAAMQFGLLRLLSVKGTGISLLKWISAFMIVQRGSKMAFLESCAWSEGLTPKPDIHLMYCIKCLKMFFLWRNLPRKYEKKNKSMHPNKNAPRSDRKGVLEWHFIPK